MSVLCRFTTRLRFGVAVLVALSIACSAPAPAAGAHTNCSPSATDLAHRDTAIAHLVDRANAAGFIEFSKTRYTRPPGDVVVSPIARWYMRFLVSMGTATPPTASQRSAAAAFIRFFNAVPGRALNGGVWVDDFNTTYGAADAAAATTLCVSTVTRHWEVTGTLAGTGGTPYGKAASTPSNGAPVDPLMAAWIRKRAARLPQMNETDEYVLGQLLNPPYIDHPFNALWSLSLDAEFRNDWNAFGRSLWYYDKDFVTGIRLDAQATNVSAYLLVGSAGAIETLHKTLDERRWKEMKGAFRERFVSAGSLAAQALAWGSFDPGAASAFGTQFRVLGGGDPARETVGLNLDANRLGLAVIDGLSGRTPHPGLGVHVDYINHSNPAVSLMPSTLYVIEERQSGAILLIGAHIVMRCTLGRPKCDDDL